MIKGLNYVEIQRLWVRVCRSPTLLYVQFNMKCDTYENTILLKHIFLNVRESFFARVQHFPKVEDLDSLEAKATNSSSRCNPNWKMLPLTPLHSLLCYDDNNKPLFCPLRVLAQKQKECARIVLWPWHDNSTTMRWCWRNHLIKFYPRLFLA